VTDPETPAPDEHQLLALIAELVAELRPGAPLAPADLDASLERSFGLDSLSRVELLQRIEQHWGVELPEGLLASAETPRALLAALGQARPRPAAARRRTLKPLPHEEARAPDAAATLPEVLAWHVRQHPERPHVRLLGDGDEFLELTYGELDRRARELAAGLLARGIEPGACVALMLPTGGDYLASFYAVLLAGAVPVPIYPPARPSQLGDHLRRHAAILGNARCVAMITVAAAKPVARLLRATVAELREVVTVDDLAGATGVLPGPTGAGDDLAFLQYTSGSTGTPKGVELTHADLLANIRAMGRAIGATPDDVFVSWLPLYHDMGLIGAWLGSLYHAIPLVLMSPLQFLARPARWLYAIDAHRGTLSAGPNFAYELCLRKLPEASLEGLDLASWRLAFNGAEPVSAATLRDFGARFAAYGLRPEALSPVYGLAECAVGLAFPPPGRGPRIDRIDRARFAHSGRAVPAAGDDPQPLELVACGRPLPGYQLRIRDDDGRELPDREAGRLQFRGPSATRGYHRNPEATAALIDGDWRETGDLAYVADGELFLTGRVKDLIIRGGRNIHPQELEAAVGDLDGVRRGCVAVFGIPDPASGTERLVVLAESRHGDAAARAALEQAIQQAAIDQLGAPAEEVLLVPPHAVLKTSSGKIRRSAMRELYLRGAVGRRPRPVWWQLVQVALVALGPWLRGRLRRLAVWGYASWVWGVGVGCTLLAAPGLLLLPRLAWRWALARAGLRLVVALIALPIRRLGQPLPPGPCMVVSNHQSYLDGLVLGLELGRPLAFVAKGELAPQRVAGTLLRRLGAVFVERFDIERSVTDSGGMARALAAGRTVCVFPEGTFDRAPGVLPFRMGAFVAAAQAGVPVVPVSVRGTRSILRSESWLPRRGAVVVHVGAPLQPTGTAWEDTVALRDAARAAIVASSGETARDVG
jgi:1-acyl-sn-glycerol-3-phosphate acyltransferase